MIAHVMRKNLRQAAGILAILVFFFLFDAFYLEIHSLNSIYWPSLAENEESRQTLGIQAKQEVLALLSARDCGIVVTMRTQDSQRFIEEVIAYYLVQGIDLLHIYDFSTHDKVKNVLEGYIEAGLVVHEFAAKPYDYEREATVVHNLAMNYVYKFHAEYRVSKKAWWLLSVDDDEFMYPSDFEMPIQDAIIPQILAEDPDGTLKEYLCSPRVLIYKTVRFRWRHVGTNWIESLSEKSFKENQSSPLDISQFNLMLRRGQTYRKLGKTAFQITHPEIKPRAWDFHGEKISGAYNFDRPGGPFFMHGNIDVSYEKVGSEIIPFEPKFLGNYALLQMGFTYHFTRSREQLFKREDRWKGIRFDDLSRAIREKDANEEQENILSRWADRVKYVILTIGTKKSSMIDYETLYSIPLPSKQDPLSMHPKAIKRREDKERRRKAREEREKLNANGSG